MLKRKVIAGEVYLFLLPDSLIAHASLSRTHKKTKTVKQVHLKRVFKVLLSGRDRQGAPEKASQIILLLSEAPGNPAEYLFRGWG